MCVWWPLFLGIIALKKIPNDARLLIDGTKSQFIDEDILETLEDFRETAITKNIEIDITGIKLKDKNYSKK